MHRVEQEFSETYRSLPEEDIAALYSEMETLTEEARGALLAEVGRRHMSREQLLKLHAVELRREGQFDRLQKLHRKRVLWWLLWRDTGIRGASWSSVLVIVLVIGVALIVERVFFHR